jgi:hypothetical protein
MLVNDGPGTRVASNEGPNGTIDRIYQKGCMEVYELVNADYSIYQGRINRRTIIQKDLQGNNFRYPCFETEDGRWFDRSGMPMPKPSKVDKEDEQEEKQEEQRTDDI